MIALTISGKSEIDDDVTNFHAVYWQFPEKFQGKRISKSMPGSQT